MTTGSTTAGNGTIVSSGSAKMDRREVKFALDTGGGITASNDTATVTFGGGTVVVESDRVLLNGQEVTQIAADTKMVEVTYKSGLVTITADGATVHEGKLGK